MLTMNMKAVNIISNEERVVNARVKVNVPDFPPWFGTDQGREPSIPEPWQPVVFHNNVVSCWGRDYAFKNSGFLTGVSSQGLELLVKPVELRLATSKGFVGWEGRAPVARRFPEGIELQSVHYCPELRLEASHTIEYDGFVTVNLKLAPHKKGVRIREWALSFYFSREISLTTFPARPKYFKGLTRDLLRKGRHCSAVMPVPVAWLGNERAGLGWLAESDENWHNKYPEKALILEKGRLGPVLTLNLADHSFLLDRPVAIQFFLQATPVKPIPRNWRRDLVRNYHFCLDSRDNPHLEFRLPTAQEIRRMAAQGVRAIIIHETWTDFQAYVKTRHTRALQQCVQQAHALGLKVLVYSGYELSAGVPEFSWYSYWFKGRTADGAMPQHGYGRYAEGHPLRNEGRPICYNDGYSDFVIQGMIAALKQFDLDGLYFDGPGDPFQPCNNYRHGCGYLDASGNYRQTCPVLKTRAHAKRFYKAIKAVKPKAWLSFHAHPGPSLGVLAFMTNSFGGEGYVNSQGQYDLRALTPEIFRACHIGKNQWGVPGEFIAYKLNTPEKLEYALALGAIHDVLFRPYYPEQLAAVSRVWKLWDRFGADKAQWHPYWNNHRYLKLTRSKSGVYASFHLKPGRAILLVIANLSEKAAVVEIKLNLDRLGFSGRTPSKAVDALTGEKMTWRHNRLGCNLKGPGVRWVWIC